MRCCVSPIIPPSPSSLLPPAPDASAPLCIGFDTAAGSEIVWHHGDHGVVRELLVMWCDGRAAEEMLSVLRCSVLRCGLPEDGLEGAQGAVRRAEGGAASVTGRTWVVRNWGYSNRYS